jgi:nicotinamidase-related amidase
MRLNTVIAIAALSALSVSATSAQAQAPRTQAVTLEKLTPENTTIVLIDYAVGFANLYRSHTVSENVRASTALAKTAKVFRTGLVVTSGPDNSTLGPLYPDLAAVLKGEPIVRRGGEFNAFDHPGFAAAVEKTGRKHLAIAGLMTEGCVLFTALEALRRGYSVSIVVDATAGETVEAHEVAIQRLIQAGAIPTTWASLATEFQVSWGNPATVKGYTGLLTDYSPQLGMGYRAIDAAVASTRAR